MENIWLGRYPIRYGLVDEKKMYADTKKIFQELDMDIDPKANMKSLSVSARQMVEIAKASSYEAKILVLDEPTSSLTEEEVQHLFAIIETLKKRNCAIIYISHKMEEILAICDEVTILRDGQWVDTQKAKDLTTDWIIKKMVGRDLTHRFPPKTNNMQDVILQVKDLCAQYQPSLQQASFELHAGEILGIAGLVGSRRTELLETIFGIAQKESGEILLHGKPVNNRNAHIAIRNGFALLTEERRFNGIFAGLDVEFNAIIASLKEHSSHGFLHRKECVQDSTWVVNSMHVKTPSLTTKINSLSGGNQQKVIIGRWLLTNPEVLLLDEPTRGIDVGAKYEIYQLIIDLANKGKGVIMVSSEMSELLGICDRILVMSNGRVAGIEEASALTQERIMTLAAKYV